MEKDILKIEFTIQGKELKAQILEMPEEWRGKFLLCRDGDFTIESIDSPEFRENTFFLRGYSRALDSNHAVYHFARKIPLICYLRRILDLLDSFCDKTCGKIGRYNANNFQDGSFLAKWDFSKQRAGHPLTSIFQNA